MYYICVYLKQQLTHGGNCSLSTVQKKLMGTKYYRVIIDAEIKNPMSSLVLQLAPK